MPASQVGGGLGIRTLGALRHTTFRESHLRPLGQPSKLYLHPIRFGKWGELMGRTQRFFRFRTLENLHKSRLFRVERSTKRFRFRVSPVMTASIPLQMQNLLYSIISRIAISLSANGAERDSRHRLRRWRITNRGSRTGSTARREHSKAHPTGSLQEPKALR